MNCSCGNPTRYDEKSSRCAACENQARRQLHFRQRMMCLSHYSQGKFECACCHETQVEFLALDHVNGGGHQDRKKQGNGYSLFRNLIRKRFPTGFRVLCHNCNFSHGILKYCPHQVGTKIPREVPPAIVYPHYAENGRRVHGTEKTGSKLTDEIVREIRTSPETHAHLAR